MKSKPEPIQTTMEVRVCLDRVKADHDRSTRRWKDILVHFKVEINLDRVGILVLSEFCVNIFKSRSEFL